MVMYDGINHMASILVEARPLALLGLCEGHLKVMKQLFKQKEITRYKCNIEVPLALKVSQVLWLRLQAKQSEAMRYHTGKHMMGNPG